MTKFFALMTCIILLFGCENNKPVELVLSIDKDFEYIPEGFPLKLSSGQTFASDIKMAPGKALFKEPEYKSEGVLYGFLPLGNAEDNRFTFVVDDIESETWIVHFDKNNNQDLTDDGPPLKSEGTGKFAATLSLEVPVLLQSGDRLSRQYRLWFWIKERGGRKYAQFSSRCHYRMNLNMGGQEYTAIVFEKSNHDALYQQSGVWIDLDHNQKLKDDEHFADGSTVIVNGKQYLIRLDHSGGKNSIEQITKPNT